MTDTLKAELRYALWVGPYPYDPDKALDAIAPIVDRLEQETELAATEQNRAVANEVCMREYAEMLKARLDATVAWLKEREEAMKRHIANNNKHIVALSKLDMIENTLARLAPTGQTEEDK